MPETWGLLPKSQVDAELIEEAIARLILEHNEDETAHLGTGQSLQSHKASEIIDHLVASIIADKIKDGEVFREKLGFNKYYIRPSFESLDNWTTAGQGGVNFYIGSCYLYSGYNLNDSRYVVCMEGPAKIDWLNKEAIFEVVFKLQYAENQLAYILVGSMPPDWEGPYLGFKVVNNNLYGCWYVGATEYTIALGTIVAQELHSYRAVLSPGEKIDFYIDNVLIATATENLPTSNDVSGLFYFYIKNTASGNKILSILDVSYLQER